MEIKESEIQDKRSGKYSIIQNTYIASVQDGRIYLWSYNKIIKERDNRINEKVGKKLLFIPNEHTRQNSREVIRKHGWKNEILGIPSWLQNEDKNEGHRIQF